MSSYPKLIIFNLLSFLLFFIITGPKPVQAQSIIPDSLNNVVATNSHDSVKQSLWPSLIASAIVPGLGQIRQENPGRAVIFYGTSLALLFNAIDNYRDYNDTGNQDSKTAAYSSLALLSQVYLVNILDVLDTHLKDKYEPWPQELYSDLPMKSPWGAVARSAMLPGWGQVYNEQYIRAIIGFGAFTYFASRVYYFNQEYKKTGNPEFRDKRVTNSWYLGLTYAIVMIDAYVDAYLYRFDEAMGMTLNVVPEDKSFAINLGVVIVF